MLSHATVEGLSRKPTIVAVRTLNMINLLEKAIDAMSFIFQIHQKDRLVGGFNPFEIGNLPQIGLKIKKN